MATARPLSPAEKQWVEHRLQDDSLLALFLSQPDADQRHAHDGAAALSETFADRSDLLTAALMHDIGKRHADIGAVGRSLATVARVLRLPVGGKVAAYNSHDLVGAEELAAAGSEPLVVLFTRHHHGNRPVSIPTADWEALTEVDHRY